MALQPVPPIRGARKSTNVVLASNYTDGIMHKRTRGGLTEPARTVGHCQNDAGTLPGRYRDTARTVVGHCQNDASTWIRIAIWRGPLPTGANLVAFELEIILETHHFGGGPPDPELEQGHRRAAATDFQKSAGFLKIGPDF